MKGLRTFAELSILYYILEIMLEEMWIRTIILQFKRLLPYALSYLFGLGCARQRGGFFTNRCRPRGAGCCSCPCCLYSSSCSLTLVVVVVVVFLLYCSLVALLL